MGRDLDQLDGSAGLQDVDRAYLVKHKVDELFGGLLYDILQQRPMDPVAYMIDSLTLGRDEARQDPLTGLPAHRRAKLESVFAAIDKDGAGGISMRKLQAYASQYGGDHLTQSELRGIYSDFRPVNPNLINLGEFLTFFARVSCTMPNPAFDAMVADMAT